MLLVIYQFVLYWIYSASGHPVTTAWRSLPALTGAALWPVVRGVAGACVSADVSRAETIHRAASASSAAARTSARKSGLCAAILSATDALGVRSRPSAVAARLR
jgi:hypothetical protein